MQTRRTSVKGRFADVDARPAILEHPPMKLHLTALFSPLLIVSGTNAGATSPLGVASEAPPEPVQHIAPEWRSRATGSDMMRVYPRPALRRGIEGLALVQCDVGKDGEMADCVVEQEAPTGQGFGDAALKLMPRFRMNPHRQDGAPVEGGVVRLPIQFRLPR